MCINPSETALRAENNKEKQPDVVIPDKQYTVIPDGGHMLHLQKGYARFQRAVADWFAVR